MSLADPVLIQPFLDKLGRRSHLGPAESRAILELPAHAAQIETNRDFVRLGERVDHVCFVVAGLVGRFGQNREGGRQITAVHIPTDMVNLNSVVAPEACSALQALSVATILRVPHEALRIAARCYPAIAEAFWRESAVDAAVLAEWIVNVGRRNTKSRTAHLLCEIACRVDGMGEKDGARIAFDATQTHIADMTGMTAVHVNRTLQALKREGIAEVHSKAIHILDWRRLTRVGDFDPAYLRIARPAQGAPVQMELVA
jgi:CRP-like cAMP-binding protein